MNDITQELARERKFLQIFISKIKIMEYNFL